MFGIGEVGFVQQLEGRALTLAPQGLEHRVAAGVRYAGVQHFNHQVDLLHTFGGRFARGGHVTRIPVDRHTVLLPRSIYHMADNRSAFQARQSRKRGDGKQHTQRGKVAALAHARNPLDRRSRSGRHDHGCLQTPLLNQALAEVLGPVATDNGRPADGPVTSRLDVAQGLAYPKGHLVVLRHECLGKILIPRQASGPGFDGTARTLAGPVGVDLADLEAVNPNPPSSLPAAACVDVAELAGHT
jgi:hypothetical protein